uniref:Acyltransferase 3 domain-containing protein n=1 Tax=Panagrolaimus sp. ES5 TaxID=591445 RepID=A0AC34EZC4_9BILA
MFGSQLGILYILSIFLFIITVKCKDDNYPTTSLITYPEDTVWSFINTFSKSRASDKCGSSLNKVETYLTDKSTLKEQRDFFHQSFTTGDASQFLSRDQDRWIFRAFKCIKAAGETSYSASQYPLHYCFALNDKNFGTAYGACIPSTCENDRFELLKHWQNISSGNKDHQELPYEGCVNSRHAKQWYEQLIPMLDFGFDMFLYLIVGLATVLHWKRGDKAKDMPTQLLLSFSLKKNIRKLTQMPKDPQSTITCMFGLRFLSLVWTLVGHSFIFVQAYLENVDEYKDDLVDNFWNQWITNFTLSVDVFLTLSGCLTAFSWFKKWQKNTTEEEPTWTSWGYWLRFYRHRLVRLWPAYIYTLLTVTSRISVTHFHGMWPPTDPAVQCPKHWWENLFFINSLMENRCMPWTWYIGTEFIFYVLSPIFLLSLRRNPTVGLIISGIVISASSLANGWGMWYWNFPPTQFLWKQPEMFNADYIKHHILMYIKPQYRIGPYIVGLLLGYYLAGFQAQTQKKQRSLKFIFTGWTIASLAGFWSLYGLYPCLQAWNWPIYHYFYGVTHRLVFSLALSWLIYACHTGIGGFINTVLSHRFLLPLSTLSYSVYLIHMIPVVFTYLLAPFPIIFGTKWRMIAHCGIQLTISYFFGIICTMVAELPALNIERIFLTRNNKKASLKPLSTQADHEVQTQLKPINNNSHETSSGTVSPIMNSPPA